MKTSELIGPALDWAVAKCESLCLGTDPFGLAPIIAAPVFVRNYSPSTDWAQGGPIVEREIIERGLLISSRGGKCEAVYPTGPIWYTYYGPTPLIAAMRCFIASKLGDEVEIPDELK